MFPPPRFGLQRVGGRDEVRLVVGEAQPEEELHVLARLPRRRPANRHAAERLLVGDAGERNAPENDGAVPLPYIAWLVPLLPCP